MQIDAQKWKVYWLNLSFCLFMAKFHQLAYLHIHINIDVYRPGVGKLSSERHWSLSNAISCPRSGQFSLVTFKGDYAILGARNYKMKA